MRMRRKLSRYEHAIGPTGMTLDRKLRSEIQILRESISVLQDMIEKKESAHKKLRRSIQ